MAAIRSDVRIFENLDAVSEAAAVLLIESCREAVTDRGRALIALSGGTTPGRLYDLLARSPYVEQIDWPHLHIFWGDERCVPPEDINSNYRQAKDAFLALVPIPSQNIHRVQSEMPPAEAAAAYALTLQMFASPPLDWPRFDLVLLGMGEDGHTASLFPHSPVDMPGSTATVTADYQGRPANRITLTPSVFNSARRVLFLAVGESKSDTLASVLNGEYRPALLPAQRIRPVDGQLVWMVDQAAASKL